MSEGIWSLLGVVVGFGLSELAQWFRACIEHRTLRKALTAELQSIVRMIPNKLDILAQAERNIENAHLMPAASVHFPSYIYGRIIETAPDLLAPAARDCLHVLHERMRIIDASMDGLEERFNVTMAAQSIGQAYVSVSGAIHDMSEALRHSQDLAESVLKGKPTNVYRLESST
jgi:hypothetical protein